MKKWKIKNYFRIGILLLGCSIFLWNCVNEKDFLEEEIAEVYFHEKRIQTIKREQIPKSVLEFIDKSTFGTKQVILNKANQAITFAKASNKSDAFGTIDESTSVMVPYEGETRYTFLINPYEDVENQVINLIVIQSDLSSEAYFVKYEFENQSTSRTITTENTDMSQFTGTITYYDDTGEQTGEITMASGSATSFTGDGTPCPNEDPDPNDPTNDDPTNDGSNTGTGGQAGDGNQPGDGTDPTHDDGSGGGELVDPDQCVVITYEPCTLPNGLLGGSNGHQPACQDPGRPHGVNDPECQNRCSGSPTTITDHCTGNTVTYRTTNDLVATDCDTTVGIILPRDECEKAQNIIINLDFAAKVDELQGKLGEMREYGYVHSTTGSYIELELTGDNGNELDIIVGDTIRGGIHSHPDSVQMMNTITDKLEIRYTIPMFSPGDIRSFFKIASYGDGTNFDISEAYSALVAPEGNYMIRFMGSVSDIPVLPPLNIEGLQEEYNEKVGLAKDKVKSLLLFLKKLNVRNLIIYEFDHYTGEAKGRYIDENGEIKTIEC